LLSRAVERKIRATQVEEGRSLAWDFIEGLPLSRIKRDDPTTWDDKWPDPYGNGIVVHDAVGHSEFMWFNRGLRTVQTIYSTIWNDSNLATGFDGFCMHRPFEYNDKWRTQTGWYHLDQNGAHKPDRICVQGFVNYYDAGEKDGGLVVVPGSHKIFTDIFKNRPELTACGDFIRLNKFGPDSPWQNEIAEADLGPIKVCAKAGDMVLWDSRMIHCNSPATTARVLPEDGSILPLRRLVAYVCMTPASRLTPTAIAKRHEAYFKGHTSSHWPEEISTAGRTNKNKQYKPPVLSENQRALIPLPENVDPSSATRNSE